MSHEKLQQEPSGEDWDNVFRYMRQATVEIVHRAGGRVNELGVIELPEGADEILFRAQESGLTEEKYSTVAEAFISRVEEIQEEARPKQEGDNFVFRIFRRRE